LACITCYFPSLPLQSWHLTQKDSLARSPRRQHRVATAFVAAVACGRDPTLGRRTRMRALVGMLLGNSFK